jgi:hypothetical protein
MLALSITRVDYSAMSVETTEPLASTPFRPPTEMVAAPGGTWRRG